MDARVFVHRFQAAILYGFSTTISMSILMDETCPVRWLLDSPWPVRTRPKFKIAKRGTSRSTLRQFETQVPQCTFH